MIRRWFKNKLGSREETPENGQFYTPLRVALHSTITVSAVDLIGLGGTYHSSFSTPNGTLDVVGIGTIDNGRDKVYRIYAVDFDETPYIIQLNISYDPRSGESDVSEVMFFQQVKTYEPLSQKEWDQVPKQLSGSTYAVDDVQYERVWGDDVEGDIDLFVFDETAIELEGKKEYTHHQMLFGRDLVNKLTNEEIPEFVLVGVEETKPDGPDMILTNVGFIIPLQAVKVQ